MVLKKPLTIAVSVFVASIAWSGVCALYSLYTRADDSDRLWGMDIVILTFSLINRLNKISAVIAQAIFARFWIHDPRAEVIALGMLCGIGFGTMGGLYFMAWAAARGYRADMYPKLIGETLHRTGWAYIVCSFLAVGLACWYSLKLSSFMTDPGAIEAALLSGAMSCIGTLSIFAFLAWIGFWGAVAGQQLYRSFGHRK
jgi:hypothetical protein